MRKLLKKWIACLLCVALVLAMTACGDSDGSQKEKTESPSSTEQTPEDDGYEKEPENAKKTIMIYLVGSDLESKYGAASTDILEMAESGIDTEKNTVLICTGGAKSWELDIPYNKNCIYRLEDGDFVEEQVNNKKNMGESETLSSFLEYGVETYPADRYGVILWNHGCGPLIGYGVDETYQQDLLTLQELSEAFSDAGFGGDNKLEFIGFDACLMSSLETAWMLKDYAKFMIASQETEPGFGWNYAFLKELNTYHNGHNIGKVIVDAYIETCEEYARQDPRYAADLTLACLDLSKIEEVESALDALFAEVDERIIDGAFARVSRTVYKTKVFGKDGSQTAFDLIDIAHMAEQLKKDHDEAEALLTALDDLVYYNRANVEHASGVSLYHPYDNTAYMSYFVSLFEEFGMAPSYTTYLKHFVEAYEDDDSSFGSLDKSQANVLGGNNTHTLSLKLTAEQQNAYLDAEYVIFQKIDGTNRYRVMYSGAMSDPSADGTISATYDRKAVYIVGDGEVSALPITLMQVKDGTNGKKYYVSGMLLSGDENGEISDAVGIFWQLVEKNGKFEFRAVYDAEDMESDVPPKASLDYTMYDAVTFATMEMELFDRNGNVLPYEDWEFEPQFESMFAIDGGNFKADYKALSGGEYYSMILVYDVNGNTYESALMPLQ